MEGTGGTGSEGATSSDGGTGKSAQNVKAQMMGALLSLKHHGERARERGRERERE